MRKIAIVHPILLALFPVLFLYSHNRDTVGLSEVLAPTLVVVGCAVFLFLLLQLALKDAQRAGLIVSILLVFFFSYGHVFGALHRFLYFKTRMCLTIAPFFIGWALLLMAATGPLLLMRRSFDGLTRAFTVTAALLVGMQLFQIGAGQIRGSDGRANAASVRADRGDPNDPSGTRPSNKPDVLPNIYYIIPDTYARADILKEVYGYDNSGFIAYLKNRGFYVAENSCSNYAATTPSLASSLNLAYVQDLISRFTSQRPLKRLTASNAVTRFLKQCGYRIVTVTEITNENADADIALGFEWLSLSDFQNLIMETTPVPALFKKLDSQRSHRRRVLYALDHLADTAKIPGPLFVFAHIMVPHQPFIFGANGEDLVTTVRVQDVDARNFAGNKKDYMTLYINQLIFTNKKLQKALDGILSAATRPTVIVLQADHGPRSFLLGEAPGQLTAGNYRESLGILNAYYLPDGGAKHLYPSISPVNTFRLIFNLYFGTKHELLKDQNYYATLEESLDFTNVTDKVHARSVNADRPNSNAAGPRPGAQGNRAVSTPNP